MLFYINGKINLFKEVLKKLGCLGLIECLSVNKFLSNADIEDFLRFIQTVPYGENVYESYVEARLSIYDNQKTKSSMTLSADPDFATQVILRVHYQCYFYVHWLQGKISPILFQDTGASLIEHLLSLGKCGLRKISCQHC